jgi:hypothetical protein
MHDAKSWQAIWGDPDQSSGRSLKCHKQQLPSHQQNNFNKTGEPPSEVKNSVS